MDYTRTPLGIKGSRNFTTANLFSKTVSRHQSVDLILDSLNTGLQLLTKLHFDNLLLLFGTQLRALARNPAGKLVPTLA